MKGSNHSILSEIFSMRPIADADGICCFDTSHSQRKCSELMETVPCDAVGARSVLGNRVACRTMIRRRDPSGICWITERLYEALIFTDRQNML